MPRIMKEIRDGQCAHFNPLSRLRERVGERAFFLEKSSNAFKKHPLPNPLPQVGEGDYLRAQAALSP
jgi:hypothetical protein